MFGRSIRNWLILFGVALCSCSMLTCDSDPTSPPPADNGKDYAVFYWDGYEMDFHRFTVVSRQADSIVPAFSFRDFAVSHDGKKLYFHGWSEEQPPGGPILDASTFELIGHLPYPGMPVVSSDGRFIAFVWSDTLRVIRCSDNALVAQAADSFKEASFSPNGDHLYAVRAGYPNCDTVYVIDLQNENAWRKICIGPGLTPNPPLVTPDEMLMYLYRTYAYFVSEFQVYDLDADTFVFRQLLVPGIGWMAMSPDGRIVYVTNPGNSLGPSPTYSYGVYNRATNDYHTYVVDIDCREPAPRTAFMARIIVTPDGRHVVATETAGFLGIRDAAAPPLFQFECENAGIDNFFVHSQGHK